MPYTPQTLLVTGGAGFIGSNFLNLLVPAHPGVRFVNVDCLTYAGHPANLVDIEDADNYLFEPVDITDREALRDVFARYEPDGVVHFAAESHVDRSLDGPGAFIQTNIVGTFNLLECCRAAWADRATERCRFHHVSTDEVYGDLDDEGLFTETTPYHPSSPYSASKASSDHLVRAYHRSYRLPVTVTNCSNNYGPRQFPEKLIPLMILNAFEGKPLPVYGKGQNIRDWLYVDDHCRGVWEVFTRAAVGETYNLGGNCELRNLDVVEKICDLVDELRPTATLDPASPSSDQPTTNTQQPSSPSRSLITFVTDRPGHDYRYAMDISKVRADLGWEPRETFDTGLRKTVRWYLTHPQWLTALRT